MSRMKSHSSTPLQKIQMSYADSHCARVLRMVARLAYLALARNGQFHSAIRLILKNRPIAEIDWPAMNRADCVLPSCLLSAILVRAVRHASAVRCGEDVLRVFAPQLGGLVG